MAKLGLKRKGFESQLDVTQYIPISDIKTDPAFQHRAKIDQRVVEDYAEVLREGGELAAVKLIRDGANLWLWDGHQTLEAAKLAGIKQLRAEIEKGTKREAWERSLGANHKHGARRTRDDLAKAIRDAITDREIRYSLLAKDEQYTYTSIARLVHTSKTSIRNHWQKYVTEEVNQEIDEALAKYSNMFAPQTEMAELVAKELYIPSWIVEQRQIEVAFNLSQLAPPLCESELVPADKATVPAAHKTNPAEDSATGITVTEVPATSPAHKTSPAENSTTETAIAEAPASPTKAKPDNNDDDDDNNDDDDDNNDNDDDDHEDEDVGMQWAPQPVSAQSSNNDSLTKSPRSDFKHPDFPIYQWGPLRRAAASSQEIEELITTIRMAGGSIMEVNAPELHLEIGKNKERKELPSLPDVWGGNTYYVLKLKVKK